MSIRFFKQTYSILASTSDTHGALGVVEVTSPGGGVPPLHVHHREDEAFFVEGSAIATPEADPRDEMSKLAEVAARYGVELLGPAPAVS